MKRKKGFTLIELLAVIVILAIIAVIATPIIVGIIEDSRKAAFQRSVEGIVRATDIDFGIRGLLEKYTYTISNGVVNTPLKAPIKNIDGFSGKIKYDEKGNSTYAVHNNKWCMKKVEKEITIDDFDINTCKLEEIEIAQDVTKNGNIVYFDVLKGKGCTVNEYHRDNSKTEYNGIDKSTDTQTNCLKFYAFNYKEGDDKVNLLLDHNTTGLASWNHGSSSNKQGPVVALRDLKDATNLWNGTLTPANYTVNYGSGEYIIEYDNIDDTLDYNARLITADEIAEITGANNDIQLEFNSTTSNQENWFYFDTNSQIESETCSNGTWNSETNEYENSNLTDCKYKWLYDRTSTSCTSSGCEHNSDVQTFGYWTANYTYGTEKNAWLVFYEGSLINAPLWDECDAAGVRPVIEVLVSDL